MARRDQAAIRRRKQESLAPIESGMHTHREPQVTGAPQRQAEKHPDHKHAERADLVFAAVVKMECAERNRKRRSRRPESRARGESEERVAAKQKFLEETHKQKYYAPEQGISPQRRTA